MKRPMTPMVVQKPVQFVVDVAETEEARARGLMDRTTTPGMLFLFGAPVMSSFWNQRTLLPLDLFYIDAEGRVVTRHRMRSIFESRVPVRYLAGAPYVAALELPEGRAPADVRQILVGPREPGRAVVTLL